MPPFRRLRRLAVLVLWISAGWFAADALRRGRRARARGPPPCVLFAAPARGSHSDQLIAAGRTIAVARALACRVLPLFLAPGVDAWTKQETWDVPLDAFYQAQDPSIFWDMGSKADLRAVGTAVEASGVPPRTRNGPGGVLPARHDLGLHQTRNEHPLAIPCLVGEHSLDGDPPGGIQQPFSCSKSAVLGSWATHRSNPDAPPSAELSALRANYSGMLLGLPAPRTLNLSCASELRAASELLPRTELRCAAKFALWNAVLPLRKPPPGKSPSEAFLARLCLSEAGVVHPLSSPQYASYSSPNPRLVTSHVDDSPSHLAYCNNRLRYPLCGTTAFMGALGTNDELEKASGIGRAVAFVAGDVDEGKPPVRKGVAARAARLRAARAVFAGDLRAAYAGLLAHPSVNFTGDAGIATEIVEQMILGCGVLSGGFLRTYGSPYSMWAWFMGHALPDVCLPTGASPAPIARTAGDETRRELRHASLAGVDFSASFPRRNGTRRATLGSGAWAAGCENAGELLPSRPYYDRSVSKRDCPACGEGKW